MSKVTNAAKGIMGVRIDISVPEDDPSNFYTCSRCGHQVYRCDLGAVIHHEQTVHEPIDLDS